MRRIALAAALTGVAALTARALAPRLHARMLAACERMFDRVPDSFPPKRMLRGIEEIRTDTGRILELLEGRKQVPEAVSIDAASLTRAEEKEVVVT